MERNQLEQAALQVVAKHLYWIPDYGNVEQAVFDLIWGALRLRTVVTLSLFRNSKIKCLDLSNILLSDK